MAAPLARDLARQIAELGSKSVRRIVRLAPDTANAYLRLIQQSGNDPEVIAAVQSYLVAARRIERYGDDATRKLFTASDEVLAARLQGMAGDDMTLLRNQLAHRRVAVLGETAPLEGPRGRVARVTRVPDVGAALLFRRFLDRVVAVSALGEGAWDDAQRLLMRGRRKLFATLKDRWTGGWEATFTYLRDHAANIAARAKELRAAEEALAEMRKTGSPVQIRAAEATVRSARQAVDGYLSKVKGLLGEAYVPQWATWKLQIQGFLEVAQREAKALGPGWHVERVVGDLRIDGAEAWDEAILLVNRNTGQAKLFLAAQYKVEKNVTALAQARNDALRETASEAGKLPMLTFKAADGSPQAFHLTPMPVGKSAHRYVFNAEGGTVSAADIQRLRAAGIEVNQLNLDVSLAEFDRVARTMLDVVADTVP